MKEGQTGGVTIIVDETSDTVADDEPVNVLIITSVATYYCDTIFVQHDKEDEIKYGDAFGNAVVDWWDRWIVPYEDPNATPLRYAVRACVTDNVNYNIGAFRKHWAVKFPKATHIRCVAHILNLVGGVFRDHKCMQVLREYMAKARSVLKGKKNIKCRQRLRKHLRQPGAGADVEGKSAPPDWADTRWSGWYDCSIWHCNNSVDFSALVGVEANGPDAPATMKDFHQWLSANAALVHLQLIFVVEHAKEVFELLDRVQVSTSATLLHGNPQNRRKPQMHRVYNRMFALHTTLQELVTQKTLRNLTNVRLHCKTLGGTNVHDVNHWTKQFLECLGAVHAKLWKYVSKHMDFAKEARIFDPRQLPNLPMDPAAYPLMLPNNVQAQVVDNGEWALYKACVAPDNGDFDIHQWRDSMKDRLPTMYPYAIQTLCIPHTSCDVERSFSMWKNVRPEKQYNMQHALHKAYVSFGFNGVVDAS